MEQSKRGQLLKMRPLARTWWVAALLFISALIPYHFISLILIGFVSYVALREYFSIIPIRQSDRYAIFLAYLCIPLQYLWAGQGWYSTFLVFIPIVVFLFLPVSFVFLGPSKGFLRATSAVNWGLMTAVFSLSHLAFLLSISQPVWGKWGADLVLYLLILTLVSDVSQYIFSVYLPKYKVLPHITPTKTVGGMLAGTLTTVAVALIFVPFWDSLFWYEAVVAGTIIGLGGFAGKVAIFVVKTDMGLRDLDEAYSDQGAILRRVASLIYTAPIFFHFVYYFYG